jgi:hypothetical protein
MANKHSRELRDILVIGSLLSIILLILFFVNLYGLITKISAEQVKSSEGNITEVTDVADIKKRMKFHGCLVCQKGPAGVWWFIKDGEQCKLWSPE